MAAPRQTLERLVTLKEAQEFLGVSRATFFKVLRSGDLPVVRIGGRTLVRPQALRSFVEARETRSPRHRHNFRRGRRRR
jgi:excisionase family DNA binding protein